MDDGDRYAAGRLAWIVPHVKQHVVGNMRAVFSAGGFYIPLEEVSELARLLSEARAKRVHLTRCVNLRTDETKKRSI